MAFAFARPHDVNLRRRRDVVSGAEIACWPDHAREGVKRASVSTGFDRIECRGHVLCVNFDNYRGDERVFARNPRFLEVRVR